MENAIQRQYEAWAEQEREWYDTCNELIGNEGWVMVSLNDNLTNETYDWLRENCYGEYDAFHREVIFKDPKKATWFALRWV